VTVAALLLTGGSSRRMGTDKARLIGLDGLPLARRTGALLAAVATAAIEVGPGRSDLPAVADDHPGAGPLAAVATGVGALAETGWHGPVIVVATDLPCLDAGLLGWLAGHPSPLSVIPRRHGRPQWLAARYDTASLSAASALVAAGARRMADLTAGRAVHLADEDEWVDAAASALAIADVDTPADLAAVRSAGDRQ
jgi:molybdopterin-guanine dinucleotide biosynthesis protein A